ncbi:MAG: sigma-54 dependent transcriptional regulator [Deltaproteobacteria bacterium]|nr:sigma-54 dependent transcriptional regulator [Deltaproteobacteria bacterium]
MASGSSKRILIVDDDQEMCKRLAGHLSRFGHEARVAGDGAKALAALGDGQSFDLVITALNLPEAGGLDILRQVKRRHPGTPVVILTGQTSVENAVEAMKEGAADFLLKPVTVELMEELASRMLRPKILPASRDQSRRIVTQDPRMNKLLDMARAVADSRATVLVSGESGTGKELFARYLHEHSSRKAGAFVAVNCASLPEGLLESELFGHEKGAFTGAVARKPGKFELASGGTILLDEVSEMAVGLQAKLLRVLQENEVDLVGGKRPVPVDVRVVATTNRDLKEHIDKGEFRQDLYYRLNVIPLKIPPLRERQGDVALLAEHFLQHFAMENNRPGLRMGDAALRLILTYTWPGNVRELMNTIERAVLLSSGTEITAQALLFDEATDWGEDAAASALGDFGLEGDLPTLRDAERQLIMRALDNTEGNRTHAAKVLGISVRTLRNKLNEYKSQFGDEEA